ncbi:hypothetical protein LNL84_09120 [Vibrio sp. ZSDZ34]|uniref:Uncharacterized protein n=1 Tax=Vibrio gelatinilyticus TaxID=2893468 RepID=A0A9X1WI07_9VIBR|nr:hypothetical protein [Vibrio gelatinilyticus]MCJ2376994.1 hypothetical protein [Vibrio gelatinilyticus]
MSFVFKSIFPKVIDNHYQGAKLSQYLFYFLTAVTLWRSQHHLLAADGGAQSIATIPLNTFSSGATSTIVGVFALWGLSQLLIAFIYLLVSIRYRSLIPLMYIIMIVEYAGRLAIGMYKPVVTAGDAPGALINLPMVLVCFSALLGSISRRVSQ